MGTYTGLMARQQWQQLTGFGRSSVRRRGRHGIASGQEYRANTYGHICLLMHDHLVLDGLTVNPNQWPVFDRIGRRTRQLGGFSFHAHGGYSKEIHADYLQQSTDGVELLQMAHYRGIGLSGWYRILNVGYRFPGLAGSDFPYARCLGDCRNYVRAETKPDFVEWTQGAAQGRSFFTTGPLLLLEIDDRRPGDTIELPTGATAELDVRIRVRSEVAPIEHVEIVVNGLTAKTVSMPESPDRNDWFEARHRLSIDQPSWIAARAFGVSSTE